MYVQSTTSATLSLHEELSMLPWNHPSVVAEMHQWVVWKHLSFAALLELERWRNHHCLKVGTCFTCCKTRLTSGTSLRCSLLHHVNMYVLVRLWYYSWTATFSCPCIWFSYWNDSSYWRLLQLLSSLSFSCINKPIQLHLMDEHLCKLNVHSYWMQTRTALTGAERWGIMFSVWVKDHS